MIAPAVKVAVVDSAGKIVTGYGSSVTLAIGTNPSGGTLRGTVQVAAVDGVATFNDLSIDKAGGGYHLVASASGLADASSQPFDVTAPAPTATHLTFIVQPSNTAAGSAMSPAPQVSAVDSTGAVVAGFGGTISLAIGTNPAGGTLSGATSATAANGVATFSGMSIEKAGSGYTLVASASGLTGASSSSFNVTAVNQPPVAAFTSSCTALACTFTSTSSDPDGTISAYSWAFGDGATATAQNPSHTYAAAGSYGVTLTVTDNQGATSSVSHTVTVAAPNQPPVVSAGSNQSVLVGVLYSFSGSFSDPDNNGPWTYTINWGDGSATSGSTSSQGAISGTHTYLAPGSYTITLTVTDAAGASGSASKVLTVTL